MATRPTAKTSTNAMIVSRPRGAGSMPPLMTMGTVAAMTVSGGVEGEGR
ncbi:hypothetical protein [Nonomuraea rubra]